MVSTKLQTDPGIVVVLVGSGGGVEVPRMVILFSKRIFKTKKKKGKKEKG
jgi:hypothetical protein